MSGRFTSWILMAAMLAGVVAGLLCNRYLAPASVQALADALAVVTNVFLRLIKMVIAPLVFSTLVAGIAKMESAAAIGRIGARTIAWFLLASLVSLTLGLLFVHLFEPGAGFELAGRAASAAAATAPDARSFSVGAFVEHLVPRSIIEAMANNEILQIVVFSCFVGTAVVAMEDRAPAVVALVEQIMAIMLKVTGYVMLMAPLALFAAIASTVATQGAGIFVTYAKFVGGFYVALLTLWMFLLSAATLVLRGRSGPLLRAIREPVTLAFSTASSEAAYPKLLEELQKIGLPRHIVGFVLPLGYSFNLDGSMMYLTFATLFIAQLYHVTLSLDQQILLLLMMMVTSKGVAGVPRASLVVIAAALPVFHLPEAGILVVLAVDHLLDMGRSATNIVGNSVACVVVQRWSGARAPADGSVR